MTEANMRILSITRPSKVNAPYLIHAENKAEGMELTFRTWDAKLVEKLVVGSLMMLDYNTKKSKMGKLDYFLNEARPFMDEARPTCKQTTKPNAEPKAAIETDQVYAICEKSAKDTLKIMEAIDKDAMPGLIINNHEVFSTIFGVMSIERFRRARP